MAVKSIPDGYHSVTPYLIVRDAASAIDFYRKAFGAEPRTRMDGPGGKVMHAELKFGNSYIMLADEMPDMGFVGPQSLGGSSISILLYVDDVDVRFKQAVAAGASVSRPLEDQFYGDRSATLQDPFGHVWTIATHKEDVSEAEMSRRFEAIMKGPGGA